MPDNRSSARVQSNARLGGLSRLLAVLTKPASLLLLVGALQLTMLAFSHKAVVDDAYISYRYAHNLVEGRGLVFNPDEYVEGFTNLLWTLMMTAPEALGLPTHLFATFLGLTFGILALIDTWRICRQLGISSWGTLIAVAVLGLYPDFWMALANGLEGGLVAFILVHIVYLLFSGKWAYAGLWGGLLFMTRPDSLIIMPVCVLYLLVVAKNDPPAIRNRFAQPLLALLTPWLALVAAVTLWRLAYYGAWIPNTIVAKSMPLPTIVDNLDLGLRYIFDFLSSAAPLSLGAILALIIAVRRPAVWLLLGIVSMQMLVVLANGGDWMPNYRLLVVYAPLFVAPLGMVVDYFANVRSSLGNRFLRTTTQLVAGLIFVAGCVFMIHDTPPWKEIGNRGWPVNPSLSIEQGIDCYRGLADTAQPVLVPTDRAVLDALGTFSYMLPNIYFQDRAGLTDSYIARHGEPRPRFGKEDPAYAYYNIQPNLFVSHSGFGLFTPMERASMGTYSETYSTYLLAKPGDTCSELKMMIGIRRDSVERILPAFAQLEPQPVTVPT